MTGDEPADSPKEIVFSGGCVIGQVPTLQFSQYESDTRVLLHAMNAMTLRYDQIVTHNIDTFLILILCFSFDEQFSKLWIRVDTVQNKRYIVVHNINYNQEARCALLYYHSISSFTYMGTCKMHYLLINVVTILA